MEDLMSDLATATGADSFPALERYYEKNQWRADDFTADDIAEDVRKILRTIRDHAALHEDAVRESSYQKAQQLLADAAARAQRNASGIRVDGKAV